MSGETDKDHEGRKGPKRRKSAHKGTRTRARIAAVEVLYRLDLLEDENPTTVIMEVITRRQLAGTAADYLNELAKKTLKQQMHIDAMIERSLTDWRLVRLSYVDRAILRLAACEMLYFAQIPPKVSIDEAVELARFYGTEGSAR
ncbi:transcription antitermination factor NusB, partial [candidate division WOR-3 bacterium]|nr:transcription antitermination factor NusB [candidate division WOR-3 bacterium]MBD3364744.1 transcription antitermination factor NusB [candidate division WOR-3 bacterium]